MEVIPIQFFTVKDLRDEIAAKEENREMIPLQDLKFAKEGDACVDIRCCEDVIILAGQSIMIKTGLYTAIPVGWEIQIRPRSGISAKTPLIMKNTIGTIDAGYRGEIRVIWHNLGDKVVTFEYGDRIAQMKVERVVPVKYIPVDTLEELEAIGVNRGGGFGSSGLNQHTK